MHRRRAAALGKIANPALRQAARGVVGSVLTQGIAMATTLQKKFDWIGVAVAGIAGAVSGAFSGRVDPQVASLAGSTAGLIAGAAMRSLKNGSDFGDNILAGLPEVIGSTIGNRMADEIKVQFDAAMARRAEARAAQAAALNAPEADLLTAVRETMYPKIASTDQAALTPQQDQDRVNKLWEFLTPDEREAVQRRFANRVVRQGFTRARAIPLALQEMRTAVDARGLNSDLLSQIEIDWTFIRAQEGFRTRTYTVDRKDGTPAPRSGVTVGTGFDLGDKTVASLRAMGVPDDLVTRLQPFLGLKGQAAKTYNDAHRITFTEREVNTLDALARGQQGSEAARYYNDQHPARQFQDLEPEFQTVIASVQFQYGDMVSRTPIFLGQVTQGRWADAIATLRDFDDEHDDRRNAEADRMERGLNRIDPGWRARWEAQRANSGPPRAGPPRPGDPRARPGDPRARPGDPRTRPGDPRTRPGDPRARPGGRPDLRPLAPLPPAGRRPA